MKKLLKITRLKRRSWLRYTGDYPQWAGIDWPLFHWSYAEKNGCAVLWTEIKWTKINGFSVEHPRFWIFIEFRRFGK